MSTELETTSMREEFPLQMTVTEQPQRLSVRDDSQFLGQLMINGVLHHITLFEVRYAGDGSLMAARANYRSADWLEALQRFEGIDDFEALEINGRSFLCVITPYAK